MYSNKKTVYYFFASMITASIFFIAGMPLFVFGQTIVEFEPDQQISIGTGHGQNDFYQTSPNPFVSNIQNNSAITGTVSGRDVGISTTIGQRDTDYIYLDPSLNEWVQYNNQSGQWVPISKNLVISGIPVPTTQANSNSGLIGGLINFGLSGATFVVNKSLQTQSGYTNITPGGLPFIGSGFGGLLIGLFTWGIGITALLAVVMIVVGGIQYMGSESIFGKDEGKKRIQAALGGLLIALASVIILTTIFGGGDSFIVNFQLG